MIVGFWNVQRVGNPDSKKFDSSARYGYVVATLEKWMKNAGPDVIILCEVSQKGPEFAKDINQSKVWTDRGYQAQFVAAADKNANVSPCSFLVITKGKPALVEPHGGSNKRPYVMVVHNGVIVCGVHIIATQDEKAVEEIVTNLEDIGQKQPAIMIGDMNYKYGATISEYDLKFTRGWSKVAPGLPYTHKGESLLDYAWVNSQVKAQAVSPEPNYSDWEVIDHAPIAYRLSK